MTPTISGAEAHHPAAPGRGLNPQGDTRMTEVQVEKWSIGIKSAITIGLFLLARAVGGAWRLATWSRSFEAKVEAVDTKAETIQQNQEEGIVRAENRQSDLQERIDQVVQVSRDRNIALDARIRPLEAQAAATTATLQAINNNILQLGADVRDLRKSVEEQRAVPRK